MRKRVMRKKAIIKSAGLRGRIVWAIALLVCSVTAVAADGERPTESLRLWPEQAPVSPDRERIENGRVVQVDNPSLTPYWPENPTGAAVVIYPGGGYVRLAYDKEGMQAVEWLNDLGVAAFVVKYRLKEYGHPAPLLDGLRAVRYVRTHAATWGLDPERIGVLGFSAGGHLAGSVALRSDFTHDSLADDPWGRVSARPDFAMLLYPVATLEKPYAHEGSVHALLGENPTDEQRREHSLEHQAEAGIPPLFLVHGNQDGSVPVQNSLMLYEAALPHSPKSELHIYQTDRHGFGLLPNQGTASSWPEAAAEWLRFNDFLNSGE